MGKIVTIEYIDDLDGESIGSGNVDTVEFSYRGHDYSLVLTTQNATQFDKDMSRYITAAKKAQARDARADRKKNARPQPRQATKPQTAPIRNAAPRKASAAALSGSDRTRAIREWAAINGHSIARRGRIPAAIQDAYDSAH